MSTPSVAILVLLGLATIAGLADVYRRSRAASIWVPRAARVLALGLAAGITVIVWPRAWADSGAFALVLLGVPVGCCLVALCADLIGWRTALVTTLAAVVALVWSLLTGLGLGFYFLLPAVLLAIAAATSWQIRRSPRHTSDDRSPSRGMSPRG
jgi:hypothetical protein